MMRAGSEFHGTAMNVHHQLTGATFWLVHCSPHWEQDLTRKLVDTTKHGDRFQTHTVRALLESQTAQQYQALPVPPPCVFHYVACFVYQALGGHFCLQKEGETVAIPKGCGIGTMTLSDSKVLVALGGEKDTIQLQAAFFHSLIQAESNSAPPSNKAEL